jgi:threonine-phosphate decarboxylase
MIKHSDHFHGSDLEIIEKVYGIKKEEIISFSANVNPLGISPKLKSTLSERPRR